MKRNTTKGTLALRCIIRHTRTDKTTNTNAFIVSDKVSIGTEDGLKKVVDVEFEDIT